MGCELQVSHKISDFVPLVPDYDLNAALIEQVQVLAILSGQYVHEVTALLVKGMETGDVQVLKPNTHVKAFRIKHGFFQFIFVLPRCSLHGSVPVAILAGNTILNSSSRQ
jgi:hypothetical protein